MLNFKKLNTELEIKQELNVVLNILNVRCIEEFTRS